MSLHAIFWAGGKCPGGGGACPTLQQHNIRVKINLIRCTIQKKNVDKMANKGRNCGAFQQFGLVQACLHRILESEKFFVFWYINRMYLNFFLYSIVKNARAVYAKRHFWPRSAAQG